MARSVWAMLFDHRRSGEAARQFEAKGGLWFLKGFRVQGLGFRANIGAQIIRMGFWGSLL